MYFETSITLQNIIYYETDGVFHIKIKLGNRIHQNKIYDRLRKALLTLLKYK